MKFPPAFVVAGLIIIATIFGGTLGIIEYYRFSYCTIAELERGGAVVYENHWIPRHGVGWNGLVKRGDNNLICRIR